MVASHNFVEHILTTFRLATEANRQTPGRQGNLVELSPELAVEVMVTGDLHGHRQNFNLLRRLAALDENPGRHLVLQEVCHGGPTYPQTGGCMSHTILEDLAALKTQYPARVHFILGNHELAELTDYPIQKSKQLLNLQFRRGLEQMYGPAVASDLRGLSPVLADLPAGGAAAAGSVHLAQHSRGGGRRPLRSVGLHPPVDRRGLRRPPRVFQLVWGRDYRGQNARAFAELVGAKILINGHEPCHEGFVAPNDFQIILDCSGQQAAYVILPVGAELSHAEIMERVKVKKYECRNEELGSIPNWPFRAFHHFSPTAHFLVPQFLVPQLSSLLAQTAESVTRAPASTDHLGTCAP